MAQFMSLALELRNMIYEECLLSDEQIIPFPPERQRPHYHDRNIKVGIQPTKRKVLWVSSLLD